MPEITFTEAKEPLKGKRAGVVALWVQKIVEAGVDGVVTWEELIDGVEHPHQYTPALHALEMVGAITRWSYSETGSRGTKVAYSLNDRVTVEDDR